MATNQSNIDILIKRRLKTEGASDSAPGPNALKNGELAMNEVDQTLYYGLSTETGTISAVPIAGDGFIKDFLSSSSGAGSLTLGTAITSDITVGSIDEGESLSKDTTLYGFLTALLFKTYVPTLYSNPSVSIGSFEVEVGEYGTGKSLQASFNRGIARGKSYIDTTVTPNRVKWNDSTQSFLAGPANKYWFACTQAEAGTFAATDNGDSATKALTNGLTFGQTNTFTVTADYDAGSPVYDSKGGVTFSYGASSVTGTLTISGKRKTFYTASNTVISTFNSGVIRNWSSQYADDKTFNLNIAVGTKTLAFAFPSNAGTNISVKQLADNGDVTSGFLALDDVEVEGANGYTATTYKVYKFTHPDAAGFTKADTYAVTIS